MTLPEARGERDLDPLLVSCLKRFGAPSPALDAAFGLLAPEASCCPPANGSGRFSLLGAVIPTKCGTSIAAAINASEASCAAGAVCGRAFAEANLLYLSVRAFSSA